MLSRSADPALQGSQTGKTYPSGQRLPRKMLRGGKWSWVVAGVAPPQKQHTGCDFKNRCRRCFFCPISGLARIRAGTRSLMSRSLRVTAARRAAAREAPRGQPRSKRGFGPSAPSCVSWREGSGGRRRLRNSARAPRLKPGRMARERPVAPLIVPVEDNANMAEAKASLSGKPPMRFARGLGRPEPRSHPA